MSASGSIARRDPESELLIFDFMGNPPGDPYPFYRKLREKAPVAAAHHRPGMSRLVWLR